MSNIPLTQALEPVEVSQADRELFVQLLGLDVTEEPERIRRGDFDGHFKMKMIARHRQSSNAASVGVDAAKAALAKLGWRIENRGGADIRVGEDWCRPATDSDTLMFNALSGIASLSTPTAEREAALVAAVRGALECLGKPDGYLPDIGAPKTRALQRAFEAYEPHPAFKGY